MFKFEAEKLEQFGEAFDAWRQNVYRTPNFSRLVGQLLIKVNDTSRSPTIGGAPVDVSAFLDNEMPVIYVSSLLSAQRMNLSVAAGLADLFISMRDRLLDSPAKEQLSQHFDLLPDLPEGGSPLWSGPVGMTPRNAAAGAERSQPRDLATARLAMALTMPRRRFTSSAGYMTMMQLEREFYIPAKQIEIRLKTFGLTPYEPPSADAEFDEPDNSVGLSP